MDVLTGRARIKRTMWSRRAQEYEAKINSGDIIAVAEVVRDLYRSEAQPEQSYSERQLFETALARLVDEVAAVDGSTETEALKRVEWMVDLALAVANPDDRGHETLTRLMLHLAHRGELRRARTTDSAEPEADNDEASEEAA